MESNKFDEIAVNHMMNPGEDLDSYIKRLLINQNESKTSYVNRLLKKPKEKLDNFINELQNKPRYEVSIKQKELCICYKRIAHFKELLNQIQGKNSIILNTELIQKVKEELGDQEPSTSNIKLILKKHKLQSHYEHIPSIQKNLGGEVIEFNPEEELKLCELFEIISVNYSEKFPFSSFPSYHYIIYKLAEYIKYPKLNLLSIGLKDSTKLKHLDHVWNVMVKYLDTV